ncbi:SRPBCC family protein [Glycomyces tritici]|uniref:SRPBCC family protein n=1 Tax=Glycomyces tritici TaxID=2665176 RepID=A0ABT7YVD1_9ACTN|nr:SRPBCC family protein [Glycomyces tritici]MDN3242588.1 SRPBCC family protein [Glycomyces tritici]
MLFTNTITIARPPAEVFAYLAELENIPQWNHAIGETRRTSDLPVGVGSQYTQVRTIPAHAEESLEITGFEPDSRLAIRGDLGSFHGEITYLLAPAVDGATALTNTMDLQASGPTRLIAPLAATRVKNAVAANLDALKRHLEKD